MVLCVTGRSKDVEDHSGEASKTKAHNNKGEIGVLYIAKTGYFCFVYDQILIWIISTMWRR